MQPLGSSPRHDSWGVVVEALEQVQVLREPHGRSLCLDLLAQYLGFSLQVRTFPATRQHLFSILLGCRQHTGAIGALLRVLDQLEPGSRAVGRARRLLDEMSARELVPGKDRARLMDMISRSGILNLAELFRAAAGSAAAELPINDQEPEEALVYLEELNARPDGVPPLLVFVEYLACQVEGHLGEQLREWSDRQAQSMGVTERMTALRSEAAAKMIGGSPRRTVAHLVIRLERDSLDHDRYLMVHWRQADPDGWHPRRGATFIGALHEIESAVAELVEEAEATWASNAVAVRVEFMLPFELLNLPVDQWLVDTESDIPRPLGLLYQVTLRSLERARTRKWHREWRRRWSRLRDAERASQDEDTLNCMSWWCAPSVAKQLRELDVTLASRSEIVSLVFRAPPVETGANNANEILIGLRNGIPVMVWQREGSVRAFETTVRPMLAGINGLPEQTRLLRGQAYKATKPHVHIGSRVTLVWDDPDRLVEPVDLPAAPSVEEAQSS